jgi:D-methionine transport system ATP-binding protein
MNEALPILEASGVEIPLPARTDAPDAREMFIEDCRVAPGEFWVLGGLPTSSPSAVIPTLAGLEKPTGGEVRLFGRDVFQLGESELVETRKRVGVVFSAGGRLLRDLTVLENIALPLRYHRFMFPDEIEDRVRRLAAALDLERHLGRAAVALSPSARQRVALARALVLEPEILFLDRPLVAANLDRHGWWLDQVQALNQGFHGWKPMAVVVGTDRLHVWRGVAGHFAVVEDRRWMHLGGAEEAREHSALVPPDWTRQKRSS